MPSTRYVTSKSTEKYVGNIPFPEDGRIVAIGGGAVIDKAKMLNKKRAIYAIPTTASGAAMTSWAVSWENGKKTSTKTEKPILIEAYRNLEISLPEDIADATFWDCVGHIKDSENSKYATQESLCFCEVARIYLQKYIKTKNVVDLIDAGNFAGRAIEITGTNFYHAISYVITLYYGYSHGKAVKEAILMQNRNLDWDMILRKAQGYAKFSEIFP